jgi:dynein light chain LC8-type
MKVTSIAEKWLVFSAPGCSDRVYLQRAATLKRLDQSFSLDMQGRKCLIKSVDMPEDRQQFAVETAASAIENHQVEKDVAAAIKKEFDTKFGPTWHCIVGRNFGSYVTHEAGCFIYFYLDQIAVLLFKSG